MDRAPRAAERPRTALTRSRVGLLASLLVGIIGSTQGCFCDGCENDIPDPPKLPAACVIDTDCGDDLQSYRFGQCGLSGCETDSDCCPGTRCRLDVNACVPHQLDAEYQCDTDADCPDPAQRCVETRLGDRPPLMLCSYERCSGDADCGIGRSCFLTGGDAQGVCVEAAPCGGGCPAGEVCDPLTSQCAPLPTRGGIVSTGCDQQCGDSGLLVIANPDTMSGEVCCELVCRCRGLPPLLPTRFGKYADIALGNGEVLVSAYDAQYGDLVLAHYKLDGSLEHVDYIDGVPLSGTAVADPTGPRRGVAEPGPDVGTHTSLAVDAQYRPRIAYHDVENRSLKVAVMGTDGNWSTYTLDTPTDDIGVVGEYTDTAVDPQSGAIFISYLAREVTGAPGIIGPVSGAKLARSRTPTPTSADDWDLFWVDARRTFDPCDNLCTSTQRCVLDDGVPTCANEATGCSGCSSTQFCVDGGVCRVTAIPPTVKDFPKVRGMYTSVAVRNGEAWLAYYDSIDGELRVGHVNTGGGRSSTVLDGDGEAGRRGGDVGRFPSIAVVGNELLVVYEDFTRHEVRAWQGADPAGAGTFAVVDSGKVAGQPGMRFVGAGLRAAIDDDGRPVVVYQDASNLDLKLARRTNSGWTPETVLEEGAHGFYAGIATADGKAYLVSVLAELDARGRERSRAAVTVHPLP